MRNMLFPRVSLRLFTVGVTGSALLLGFAFFAQGAAAQRAPSANDTLVSCEDIRRQLSAEERGTTEYVRLRGLFDSRCAHVQNTAPSPVSTSPTPIVRESCDELLMKLRDARVSEEERTQIQRRWQSMCGSPDGGNALPADRCEELRKRISTLDTDTDAFSSASAEYARLCMDTSTPQLLPLPAPSGTMHVCETIRRQLSGASEGTDEYRRLLSSYESLCKGDEGASPALLRTMLSPLPELPDLRADGTNLCEGLRMRIKRHIEAGSTEGEEYANVRNQFASSCMPAAENPCLRLRSALAALERTPSDADRMLLSRLCANDDSPAIPDRRLFCVRMRTHMEEQGDVSEEDRALYYRACFPQNNHVPDPSPCRELRERIVRLLNARGEDEEDLATLRARFQASCAAERSVPPAGFEENVLSSAEDYANPFPDTEPEDDEGKAAVELYRRGVIGGFPDGEFKGDRPVNRAEAAKFLLLACNRDTDADFSGRLRDIVQGEWYVPFVEAAATQGIIGGYPDGTFRPGNTVNRAEFLKMLTLACNLETGLPHAFTDVSEDDWFDEFAGTAARYGLYDGEETTLLPGQLQSRRETAVAIFRYLEKR